MSDCILWTGGRRPNGYGRKYVGGRRYVSAHRWAFEEAHGVIPEGLWVLHRCHVRLCINPEHLYAGTPTDNNRDTVDAGHHVSANAAKTHCPRGHEYDYVTSQGKRGCRTCQRAWQRESNRKVSA